MAALFFQPPAPESRAGKVYERLVEGARLADDEGRHEEALAVFEALARDAVDAAEWPMPGCVAEALFRASQALFDLGRAEDGLARSRELVDRYAEAPEFGLRQTACHALWITAFTLRNEGSGRHELIVALCDEGVARFGDEKALWMRQRVLHFMIDKSFALAALGRREEGLALCEAVRARYGADADADLRAHAERVMAGMTTRFAAPEGSL